VGDEKGVQILVGNPQDRKPFGGPKRRWDVSIRMYLAQNSVQ